MKLPFILYCIFTLILIKPIFSQTTFSCDGFSITGTTISPYYLAQDSNCTINPQPKEVLWTGYANRGFLKYTIEQAEYEVQVSYTIINTNDIGTITTNGGGTTTIKLVDGCVNVSGNKIGPYIGKGNYGDAVVIISSNKPFTEILLRLDTPTSGICSGDCRSVILGPSKCRFDLGANTTLCPGKELILDTKIETGNFLWQDGSKKSTYLVTKAGKYKATVIVDKCKAIDSIEVNYYPEQNIINKDTLICEGDEFKFDVTTPNSTYLWQDNTTLPYYTISKSGTYAVKINNHCPFYDTLRVESRDCTVELELPNIFTPNNDSINERFTPIKIKGIVSMQTKIYNRWGNKVHETNNPLIEWDGGNLSDGIYFWTVNYTDLRGNQYTEKGYVHIAR